MTLRVPLTLATALAFHVSMSPPPTSDTDTPSDRRTAHTSARVISAMLTKGLFWASALTDALVVLAPHPTHQGPGLGLGLSVPTSIYFPCLPPLPLVTVAGTTLALTGAYLRYAAYHALGRFYACPNHGPGPCVARGHAHALITSGPYALVRHPGYAGLLLCTTGLVVVQLDALKGSGVGTSVWMRAVALACAVMAGVGALRRIQDEEKSLRAQFKGEWQAWAAKVPYKLIPGVY